MSTASLVLRLAAPMQSWGLRARFEHRDTGTEPTKSGIVGLLAAALGLPRDADPGDIAELAALEMAVRCDREGRMERDYQTVQNVPTTTGSSRRTIVSERYYLADGCFLVVLHGPRAAVTRYAEALRRPRFPLFLGRRAFPAPPDLVHGVTDEPLVHVIHHQPRLGGTGARLRVVADCPVGTDGAETRPDHPVSFALGRREYAPRSVHTYHVAAPGGEG